MLCLVWLVHPTQSASLGIRQGYAGWVLYGISLLTRLHQVACNLCSGRPIISADQAVFAKRSQQIDRRSQLAVTKQHPQPPLTSESCCAQLLSLGFEYHTSKAFIHSYTRAMRYLPQIGMRYSKYLDAECTTRVVGECFAVFKFIQRQLCTTRPSPQGKLWMVLSHCQAGTPHFGEIFLPIGHDLLMI